MIKKLFITSLTLVLFFLLSGCTQAMISDTGLDLSDLEQCIDDMVDANSITACDAELRESLLEDYIASFETEFDTTGSLFEMTQLDYSISKDGSIERIEFWFQYALLPEAEFEAGYDTFKSIIRTMSIELRAMNDVPEFIFSGEFLFYGDYAYKYHHDLNDDISSEMIFWGLLSDFETTYNTNETFILNHLEDSDFIEQKVLIVSTDHSAEIIADNVTDTYTRLIYFTNTEAVLTVAEAESIIETSLSTTSLTLE